MKILYFSAHGILEYDEVKLLTEMGHEVFCLGDIYGNERPLVENARDTKCSWFSRPEIEEMQRKGQGNLPDFAIERCEAIVCMHLDHWLSSQWEKIKGKKCFLRLIGQHRENLGIQIKPMTDQGLKVIPYWETDEKFNWLFQGQTTETVHFYKDEAEFDGWTGRREMVLTVCNDIKRGDGKACHADLYKEVTAGLPRLLVGKNNRFFGDFTARVPYWMLKELYRDCRAYLYIGTEPATYTLNLIEAMMTGMPVVAFDNGRGIKDMVPFASSDPDDLYDAVKDTLNMPSRYRCRDKAIELFGKKRALEAWKRVLDA